MGRRRNESVRVGRGIPNVLADLGVTDASELTTKVRLAVAINRLLQEHGTSQVDAAGMLGINQPKISALRNFKVDGFSVERLMTFLTTLGSDVEITVRPRRRATTAGRISVHYA